MTMLVTETMVEAFQSKYREIAKRCNWGDSWPAGDEVRELLCASMTPTQPTATTTEALRLPEGTLSMQGNDITIAYATREDAERAFDVLEAALSTAPSGDGVPGMVHLERLIDHHVTDDDDRMSLKAAIRSTLPDKLLDSATIEVCARLVEANMLCEATGGVEVLHPRTNPGNKVGQAYADAIRALSTASSTGKETP